MAIKFLNTVAVDTRRLIRRYNQQPSRYRDG